MNLKALKKIGTYGTLLVILSSACTITIVQANNEIPTINQQSGNKEEYQALEALLVSSEYKSKTDEQKLACILATCFCNFNVKGHFSKFVKTLISFLENSEHAAQLKKRFPSINIAAIITALKKVENDKFSAQIVIKLQNYISLFPTEFANMLPEELVKMDVLAFRSRISQRLQDKA